MRAGKHNEGGNGLQQ